MLTFPSSSVCNVSFCFWDSSTLVCCHSFLSRRNSWKSPCLPSSSSELELVGGRHTRITVKQVGDHGSLSSKLSHEQRVRWNISEGNTLHKQVGRQRCGTFWRSCATTYSEALLQGVLLLQTGEIGGSQLLKFSFPDQVKGHWDLSESMTEVMTP